LINDRGRIAGKPVRIAAERANHQQRWAPYSSLFRVCLLSAADAWHAQQLSGLAYLQSGPVETPLAAPVFHAHKTGNGNMKNHQETGQQRKPMPEHVHHIVKRLILYICICLLAGIGISGMTAFFHTSFSS
jgi:hypothetical protein